jgi:tetratricopeptide (TPR) repeat protein
MAQGATHTPEFLLEKALTAGSASLRAKYATRGLSHPTLQREMQQLLLRQLYLAHLERAEFAAARSVAEQMIAIGEMLETVMHDAARACMAQGDLTAAAGYLRLAARHGPPHRRALHLWTLGRALYLGRQYGGALAAFRRALRWASTNQELYRAHAELARFHLGEPAQLRRAYEELGAAEPLPLYAEFLGGEFLRLLQEPRLACSLWREFLRQAPQAPLEIAVGLRAEVRQAELWLQEVTAEASVAK